MFPKKVHRSHERAKRIVHLPHRRLRKARKAAAPPLLVLRKAQDPVPSLHRHQGKAHGLDPRVQDQDRKEPSLRVRNIYLPKNKLDIVFLKSLPTYLKQTNEQQRANELLLQLTDRRTVRLLERSLW